MIKACARCGIAFDAGAHYDQQFCSRQCYKWKNGSPIERFLSHVEKKENGCWAWKAGTRGDTGYGSFCMDCKTMGAHQASWILFRGPITAGLLVLHTCDVRLCVNPDHLYLGTRLDNAQDAKERGRLASGDRSSSRLHPERVQRGDRHGSHTHPERRPRGEAHGHAKLTTDQVIQMRAMVGCSERKLSSIFKVSSTTIHRILKREIWAHV